MLGNAEDASDITQVVFMRVTERLDDSTHATSSLQLDLPDRAQRVAQSRAQAPPRGALEEEDELPARDAEPDWNADRAELSERIRRPSLGMNTDDRAVITLRHFSDCSYREMSGILGIAEKTVKSRLFAARRRLRELLSDLRPA